MIPIGHRLALDLIHDGMTRSLPKWRTRLITWGLRLLYEPPPPDLIAVARVLVRFADGGDGQRHLIAEALRDALGGSSTAWATAELLQRHLRPVAEEIDARQDTRWLDAVRERPGTKPPVASANGWQDFDEELTTFPAPEDSTAKIQQAAEAIRKMAKPGPVDDSDFDAVIAPLADDSAAEALAAALQRVAVHEPALVATLRDRVLPDVQRGAVGEALR